jgi:hypothetical protein
MKVQIYNINIHFILLLKYFIRINGNNLFLLFPEISNIVTFKLD